MEPKTPSEIEDMRTGGQMLSHVLQYLIPKTVSGVTTGELAKLAALELARLGGKPAFLGYQGYPDCICISVNEQVVHGIPGERVIKSGDVVGLDFGVNYNAMITDGAVTIEVEAKTESELVRATREALEQGIKAVRAGAKVGDISAAVQGRLERANLGIVRELAGHGVGHQLHEEPWIPNFGRAGEGMVLSPGMTIAIEPMSTVGSSKVKWGADGWTVSTADGSLAAHFEHTVLVTASGSEILTKL